MAIWQFQCNIVPARDNIEKLRRDEIISWKDVPHPTYDIEFLEEAKSWSKDIVLGELIMKLNELCDELKRLGVSKGLYSIMPNGMPNEKLCLECEAFIQKVKKIAKL